MMFTETERRAFARHESEQRQHEASLSCLAMLAQMQRVAAQMVAHGTDTRVVGLDLVH